MMLLFRRTLADAFSAETLSSLSRYFDTHLDVMLLTTSGTSSRVIYAPFFIAAVKTLSPSITVMTRYKYLVKYLVLCLLILKK